MRSSLKNVSGPSSCRSVHVLWQHSAGPFSREKMWEERARRRNLTLIVSPEVTRPILQEYSHVCPRFGGLSTRAHAGGTGSALHIEGRRLLCHP